MLVLIYSIAGSAQTATDSSGSVFLFSSVGLSLLKQGVNPSYASSVQTATGFGYQFSSHSSLAGMLSFDGYGYKKLGTAYNLDGTLRATALALLYRYTFGSRAFRPYLNAGGGGVRFSVPTVNASFGTTNISNKVEILGFLLAEAGVQVRVLARYSLFVGAEGRWVGKSSLLNDASLQPTTIKIGLVSAF